MSRTPSPRLSREEILRDLTLKHQLHELDIYLLSVVPLIEMIWADDKVQMAEVNLLRDFTNQLLKSLNQQAGFEIVVPQEHADAFIQRFLQSRPPQDLIRQLRHLSLSLLQQSADAEKKERELLDYCFDIAAASVAQYPYADRERISDEEKALLHELIRQCLNK